MLEKKEFPTLQSISTLVVARNYHLYPELKGLPERVKETVSKITILRSLINPSQNAKAQPTAFC